MEESKKLSFSAANIFPVKVFLEKELADNLNDNTIPAYHVQLSPTNRCNFKCSFCSCGKVDRKFQLEWEELKVIMETALNSGMKAITITGGGEPTLYPNINELIAMLGNWGVSVGMVTNGTMLDRLDSRARESLSWIRISASDNLEYQLSTIKMTIDKWLSNINEFHKAGIKGQMDYSTNTIIQDFAFSYVVGPNPDTKLIGRLINFANEHHFTNVRLVPDLNRLDVVPAMEELKSFFYGMNDSIVNYQERVDFKPGDKECWISLLKPMIAADGYIYPCCGVQYAKGVTLDFDTSMRICKAIDIDTFCSSQKPFDGSACTKCYYNNYNRLLSYYKHWKDIVGMEFV